MAKPISVELLGSSIPERLAYAPMAKITIEPDRAKLLDFETTIPKAVDDLVKAHGDPRS